MTSPEHDGGVMRRIELTGLVAVATGCGCAIGSAPADAGAQVAG